jgi:hypothetical protein
MNIDKAIRVGFVYLITPLFLSDFYWGRITFKELYNHFVN